MGREFGGVGVLMLRMSDLKQRAFAHPTWTYLSDASKKLNLKKTGQSANKSNAALLNSWSKRPSVHCHPIEGEKKDRK